MRPRLRVVVALAVLVIVAAACSSAAEPEKTFEQPQQRVDTGPGCDHIVASEGKRFRNVAKSFVLEYLVEASVTPTVCYDEISFVFDPGDGPDLPPAYTVEYKKPPFVEGINTTTEGFKEAKAYLYIEFQPTATVDRRFAGSGRLTYRGNQRLALEPRRPVKIVEWLKDYEDPTPEDLTDDKVIWVIGVDEKRPFTVDSANQPPRVNVIVMR
ncbi:MAG: hypothetical protein WEC34_02195 [Acidimicrobiia bacterium]|jgi:hypothetical protein